MWMPEESEMPLAQGTGATEIAGEIVGQAQLQPGHSGGLFGGRQSHVWTFRIRPDGTQETVHCRLEGRLDTSLAPGDHVQVAGSMVRGVLHAARIRDERGTVLGHSSCFVATVVCGDPLAPEVEQLRWFRDRALRRCAAGRAIIAFYWRVGPPLARCLARSPTLCRWIRRFVLAPLCWVLRIAAGCPEPPA